MREVIKTNSEDLGDFYFQNDLVFGSKKMNSWILWQNKKITKLENLADKFENGNVIVQYNL